MKKPWQMSTRYLTLGAKPTAMSTAMEIARWARQKTASERGV